MSQNKIKPTLICVEIISCRWSVFTGFQNVIECNWKVIDDYKAIVWEAINDKITITRNRNQCQLQITFDYSLCCNRLRLLITITSTLFEIIVKHCMSEHKDREIKYRKLALNEHYEKF